MRLRTGFPAGHGRRFQSASDPGQAWWLSEHADREATVDDLAELRRLVTSRRGVEFYVESETAATDSTAVAVVSDGEWIRRRVGSRAVARKLAAELGIPAYDAAIVGYPDAMRRYRRPESGH